MNKRRRWKAKARRKASCVKTISYLRLAFHPGAFELVMEPLRKERMADIVYGIGYFRDLDGPQP